MRSVRDSDANSKSWQKNRDIGKTVNALGQALEQTNKQVQKIKRRIVGGVGGGTSDLWPPTELDQTVTTPAGAYKYISPQNVLVTTPVVDLVLGVPTPAIPGRWRAVKDVPAATVAGYNIPQIPPILGVPVGTPLKGDAEGENVFWLPEWIYSLC